MNSGVSFWASLRLVGLLSEVEGFSSSSCSAVDVKGCCGLGDSERRHLRECLK